MADKRLIDANALLERYRSDPSFDISVHTLNEEDAPTVDAVPVVRCKDCKWVEKGKDYEAYCNHWKSGLYADVKDDDFCSYGERRTEE